MQTTNLIFKIIAGIFFLSQAHGFFKWGQICRRGIQYKRLGNEKLSITEGNLKEATIQYMFAILSLLVYTGIVLLSSNWVFTAILSIYMYIAIDMSELKRNYLTFKHGLEQYLWRGPFWLFCDEDG